MPQSDDNSVDCFEAVIDKGTAEVEDPRLAAGGRAAEPVWRPALVENPPSE